MENDLISLDDGPDQMEAGSGVPLDSPNKAVISESVASDRAEKANFGLKELSPGADSIRASIASGDENYAREASASKVATAKQALNDVIISGIASKTTGPVTPEELGLVRNLAVPDTVNPGTVWESQYSKAFFDRVALSKDSDGVIDVARTFASDKVFDMLDEGTGILTKTEIARTKKEDLDSRWDQASNWTKGLDIVETLIPGKSWYNTWNAVPGVKTDGLGLPGTNIAEQVQGLWLLSPDEFEKKLDETLTRLADTNMTDARNFAEAVLQYSSTDAAKTNLFGLLDLIDVGSVAGGAVKIGAGLLKSGAKAVKATVAEQRVLKAVDDALKASAGAPEKALEVVGDTARAAEAKAIQKVVAEGTDVFPKPEGKFRGLLNTLPSLIRPTSVIDDLGSLTTEAATRLANKLQTQGLRLSTTLDNIVQAERLTPQALAEASQRAIVELKEEFKGLNDSVMNIVRNPRDVASNTDSVSLRLGDTDAQPFSNPNLAQVMAKDVYELPDGLYSIKQEGTNFYIDINRTISEVGDSVTSQMVTATNHVPKSNNFVGQVFDMFLGKVRGASEVTAPLQRQNRLAAQFGHEQLLRDLREVMDTIGTVPKKQRKDFESVLAKNRDYVDPVTGDKGKFYSTVGEMQSDYVALIGREPSQKEIEAYFSYVQLSDFDWIMRNTTMLKDKERLGLGRYSVKLGDNGYSEYEPLQILKSDWFEAKKVDHVPWNTDHLGIMIIDEKTKSVQVVGRNASAEVRAQADLMVKEGGYDILQVGSPSSRPLKESTGVTDPIQYVITKGSDRTNLDPKQIGYVPGGHVEYKNQWWVKQAKVHRTADGVAAYEGDTVAFNFSTQAQANKFAARMDEARLLLKSKNEAGLAAYLEKNLPYSVDSFKKLFAKDEGYYDLNQSFKSLASGQRVGDVVDFKSEYGAFRDLTKSDYSLTGDIDRKFAGQRSEQFRTVSERGTEEKPVFDFVPADKIDPLSTLARSIGQASRSKFFGDLKISTASQFVEEFARVLDAPISELREYPMYFLHNPKWKTGVDDALLNQAQYTQANALAFLGQQTAFGRQLDWIQTKMSNAAYNVLGEATATRITGSELLTSRDPASFFRGAAFHAHLGLFNPIQLFLQAQGAVHMLGIAPRSAWQSLSGGALQKMLMMNDTPEILASAAQKATKLGWKKEDFIESWELMKQTGWFRVGREAALIDNMRDPSMFTGHAGSFLDKGTIFFKQGEQFNRVAGWNAAYLEWRKANPGKAVGNRELGEILAGADKMTLNMTRAGKASWETGVLSIPFQFQSYSARLMDQMIGKQLTAAEKARVFGVYSAMYGVPAGLAAGTGYPFYEDIRTMAIENGVTNMDKFTNLLIEGVPAAIMQAITGQDYSLGNRFGPGGFSIVKDLISGDKGVFEIAMGPGGNAGMNLAGGAWNVLKGFTEVFREGGSYEPLLSDIIDASKEISSVNQAVRLTMALNTGKYISKTGGYVSDISSADAIMSSIAGITPRDVTDTYLMQRSLSNTKEAQKEAEKLFTKEYRRGMQEAIAGNDKASEAYMKRARAYLVLGDFQPSQYSELLRRANDGYQSMAERVATQWWKNAPASKVQQRMDQSIAIQKGQ